MDIIVFLYILSTCFVAGIIGSLLGLGGGIIIVPALTLLFNVPMHLAIGSSFIGVLVNSSSASSVYIKNRITDIRLSSSLELGAVIGAITGAYIALSINSNILSVLFGITLSYVAINMYTKSKTINKKPEKIDQDLSEKREYFEKNTKQIIKYSVIRTKEGVLLSSIGGIFAGLLGVGGGSIFVPIMNRVMNVPLKVAIATSSFMIGMTSLVGAIIFLMNGFFDPEIIAPLILGMFFGAQLGSRINRIIDKQLLNNIFVIVIFYIAFKMIINGLGINVF